MPLYHVTPDKLEPVPDTNFATLGLQERKDIQRMLRADISPLGGDLMVLAEEFSNWEDSSRRIDLLCLDKQARLVVVEIKRTDDGGHMELQAVRYAAMVSSMTLEQAIAAHARSLSGDDAEGRARRAVLEFLELDNEDEAELTDEVRIILVSADFSTEVTTAVIWLNRHDLDITCVRIKPYRLNETTLIDVTQIIPLPESADYEVKVRAQAQEVKKVRTARQEIFRRFWGQLIDKSRARTNLLAARSTTTDHWLSAGIGRSGFALSASVTEDRARVECYIRLGKDSDERNKSAFRQLLAQREAIERTYGGKLEWNELPDRIGCRINDDFAGGWKSPEDQWPGLQDQIIDRLVRLEAAFKGPIQALKV